MNTGSTDEKVMLHDIHRIADATTQIAKELKALRELAELVASNVPAPRPR